MGLSTEESWKRTPREFDALRRVFERSQKLEAERWAVARMDYRNVNFKHPQGRGWTIADFIGSPKERAQATEAHWESQRAIQADRVMAAQMKAGQFDESELPVWARKRDNETGRRQ